MIVNGSKVYNEGVELNKKNIMKIKKIIKTVKKVSPKSEISLRLLKDGDLFEGLIWGDLNDTSIGAYRRGSNLSILLDRLNKKLNRDYRREIIKLTPARNPKTTRETNNNFLMEMAS